MLNKQELEDIFDKRYEQGKIVGNGIVELLAHIEEQEREIAKLKEGKN